MIPRERDEVVVALSSAWDYFRAILSCLVVPNRLPVSRTVCRPAHIRVLRHVEGVSVTYAVEVKAVLHILVREVLDRHRRVIGVVANELKLEFLVQYGFILGVINNQS